MVSEHRARVSEILLDLGAVHCNLEKSFIFTSGWASPVYVNCRKLVSTTWERREVVGLVAQELERALGRDGFDVVAGGETAGIPYAAWVADYFYRPMIYVRKKPKGFGLGRRIEGELASDQRVVLIEDLMTDGMSKIDFARAIRDAGGRVTHAVVVFSYGVYPEAGTKLAAADLSVHALTDWRTTLEVAESRGDFDRAQVRAVREFLHDPPAWSQAHGGSAG
ncbi:MAG: orotate phosphoribosyltransferase [Gammaproteobacteria bacterium]|nr:orotate phosphoribosyltransferase [Gammaproteobacteria bacterium]NIR84837.1 orotate phosphoribosyltransferase [Gammaproteobacteria bacterium]NIR91551.1 orotate phosphoribosyltransferase [Gammaproteobacteria bacterium]NIU05884.1 orotate phosphoribosyltransferase [Gammaproteobacteria bacterium]NIV76739.1 orotate phosphoribosyltransferase [Gammaproteobacteria bacterium]